MVLAHSGGMTAMNEQSRPLLISSSLPLIDEIVRLASSAALEVHVASDVGSASTHWFTAPLVIVGSDAVVEDVPGRRARVVVIDSQLFDQDSGDSTSRDAAAQRDIWRFAVELGAEHVVELPDGEQWLLDAFRECAEGPTRNGVVVPILGGSGGVGVSTLSVNLAIAAHRSGVRSLVIDADPWGGGLDLLMGVEEKTGARWSDLQQVTGHLPAGHLDAALPKAADVAVLSCARDLSAVETGLTAETMSAVLASARRSHDLVVLDCSRTPEDVLAVVFEQAGLAVLLVGDHVRATAAAARRHSWIRLRVPTVHVVQANTPRGIASADIERVLGSEFVASVPFVPSMPLRSDEGELPALPRPYRFACQQILEVVYGRGDNRRAA